MTPPEARLPLAPQLRLDVLMAGLSVTLAEPALPHHQLLGRPFALSSIHSMVPLIGIGSRVSPRALVDFDGR